MIAIQSRAFRPVRCAVALAALSIGCHGKTCPTTPQPGAVASAPAAEPSGGPGQIDPALAAIAHQASGVHKIKLRIDSAGNVLKIAIYHRDASQVSESAVQAVEQRFPGARIGVYENERYHDAGAVHEVEFTTVDGQKCEMSRTAAGDDRYVECQIAAAALPAPVAAAVEAAAPGSEIVEAESKEWADGRKHFHVEAKRGEVLHYLILDVEGKLVERYLRVPAAIDLEVAVDK